MAEAQLHQALFQIQASSVIPPCAQRLRNSQRSDRHRGAVLFFASHEAFNLPIRRRIIAVKRCLPRQAEGLRRGGVRRILIRGTGIKGDVAQLQRFMLRLTMYRLPHPAVAQQHAFVESRSGGVQPKHMVLHVRIDLLPCIQASK